MKERIIQIIGALSLLLLIALLLGGLHEYKKQIAKMEKDHEALRQRTEVKEKRIDDMEKTLLLVYNLSQYEAHYYSVIFDDFAQKDSVPWVVYPALIRIESNFNPTVISSAKCKGLTQVAEGTGKGVAEKLGIIYNETTLWNDILNLIIGFTYFNQGFTEVRDSLTIDESLKHAMKRYCGGPGYQKINTESRAYVGEYKSTVWQEYIRLSYIYKGVLYEDMEKNKQEIKKSQSTINWIMAGAFKIGQKAQGPVINIDSLQKVKTDTLKRAKSQ